MTTGWGPSEHQRRELKEPEEKRPLSTRWGLHRALSDAAPLWEQPAPREGRARGLAQRGTRGPCPALDCG